MIEIDLSTQPVWGSEDEWQLLSEKSVTAAIAVAPYARLSETQAQISVSIRFADNDEVQKLNRDYRKKDRPTNILSFPMLDATLLASLANTDDGEVLLGDMILAHEICTTEAEEKGVPLPQHTAHLIVHGTLHLLGFDHIDDIEAGAMEALEVKALASMGLPNPYI